MKRSLVFILTYTMLIALVNVTAFAQQTVAPTVPPERGRGAGQQPLRDAAKAAKAAKQANQEQRKLSADQPKLNQQQRNRIANTVVDRYLGGFQKNVGLSDEQTGKLSPVLGRFVRQQLLLAQNRSQAIKRLTELSNQQATEEDLQAQKSVLETTEKQLLNREKSFYAELNPQLTPQQQTKLKLYLIQTDQEIRQAIQKSAQ